MPHVRWAVAAALLLGHLLTLGRYGIFRDEFYYLANGRHLAWGYVDHPPFIAALAWLIEHTLGTSVYALRAPMLLALACTLAAIAVVVRRLGGGSTAITAAWLAFALSPYYLFAFHYLSMNAPEILWWSLAAILLFDATGGFRPAAGVAGRPHGPERARTWLLFGTVMGLAALTKVSGLVWGVGLAIGWLLSSARNRVLTPWPWVAAAIALAMFAPHVAWQAAHGWPTAEFVRNAQQYKITSLSAGAFLLEQITLLGPVGATVALFGLVGLASRLERGRAFAAAFLFVLAVFLVQRSKPYYTMPAYPVLLAAGGVLLERWAPWRHWWGRLGQTVVLLLGIVLVPVTLPVLPPDRVPAYLSWLGITVESGERHAKGALPQHFADMFGWETLADDVASVARTLTPAERATARVYTQNYGEAGALQYYGPSRGVPPVISGHNAYWHWGPGPDTGGVLIIVGGDAADHRQVLADVREMGRTTCTRCMPYEQHLPIFVARGWKRPLTEVWPMTKHFE